MCDAKGTAKPVTRIDNNRVRVTEWRFAKRGDNTGWHRHEFDYVVVPLFDGGAGNRAPGRVAQRSCDAARGALFPPGWS